MYEDSPPTTELRLALDAYEDARSAWRATVEDVGQQLEAMGRGRSETIPSNERQLYRLARKLVDTSYLKDASEAGGFGELTQIARRYLTEFSRLDVALENLRENLENISEEAEPEEDQT